MPAPIKIAVAGALGRMGQAVAAEVARTPGLKLVARFDRQEIEDRSLVTVDEALAAADVVIDFTLPAAAAELARHAASEGSAAAFVIGPTGFNDAQLRVIAAASKRLPIVRAGNFSLGLNMLLGMVRQAAAALGPEYDIEIFEAHHRNKVDAPSGAALMLGQAAAEGRGVDLAKVSARGRDGITGARRTGDIGFSVMRGGGIIGEHSVTFAADDEVLTLSHSAHDRGLFARGAVAAARWVAGRPPGQYGMADVLGFGGKAQDA